jgi:hypothetical protein
MPRKQGLALAPEDIQERADQFRRIQGLHRAADMNHYLDSLGVSLDEFEDFITDGLYHEKMMEQVCSDRPSNSTSSSTRPSSTASRSAISCSIPKARRRR